MAVIRLDDDGADNIENTLSIALVDSASGAVKDRSLTTVDPLASSTWELVKSFLLQLCTSVISIVSKVWIFIENFSRFYELFFTKLFQAEI